MGSAMPARPAAERSRSRGRRALPRALSRSSHPPREPRRPCRKRYSTWRVRHYQSVVWIRTVGTSWEGVTMSPTFGVLALLQAKPGKGEDLGKFLEGGRDLAVAEPGTVTWYAFKISDTTYGIFDTFDDDAGRQAHLNGQIPAALGQVADELLASAPDIRTVDVLAVK